MTALQIIGVVFVVAVWIGVVFVVAVWIGIALHFGGFDRRDR